MKLPVTEINKKLEQAGLIKDKKVISFAAFKKLVDIHPYGRGRNILYIVYAGHPKENLIAFYPPQTTKAETLQIAYEYLVDTVTTEMKQEYLDGNVMWGNCGIPICYGNVRATF